MSRRLLRWTASIMTLGLIASANGAPPEANLYGIAPQPFSTTTTPLSILLGDPQARTIVAQYAASFLTQPGLPQTSGMTLSDVQPFAPGVLTVAAFEDIDRDLAKLPPSPAAAENAREAVAEIQNASIDRAEPWITHPDAYAADYDRQPIALQFRRTLSFSHKPKVLRVRVSADNRFVLYVNGQRVAAGPARGDLNHYRYEVIDLAPFLKSGRNLLAAQVWSDGKFAPIAQISTGHTGFMLRAENGADPTIDAGYAWQVRRDRSRMVSSGPRQIISAVGPTYYAAGGPEQIDAGAQLERWTTDPQAGGDWRPAVAAVTQGGKARHLVADQLPQMRDDAVGSGRVVRVSGAAAGSFPSGPMMVPRETEATLLIDTGKVQTFYPALVTSGGKGAIVSMTYVEALYEPARGGGRPSAVRFSDRSRVDDGRALGLSDCFTPDGRSRASFSPYWWRAGRFIEIKVKTAGHPIVLDRLDLHRTGYPFKSRGSFVSSDAALNEIWKVGWETAQFDAHETYMDTAYWEQLQYIGDSRVQAMLSYTVAGDPRLAIQALDAFDASRIVDGLPQSSWPISGANPIPPFALLWVGMLHDFWMRQPDVAVLRRHLAGMRSVLDWYKPYVREDGIVRATPGWLFVDWRDGLDGGRDRSGNGPDSCIISLLRLGALKEAADIEGAVGSKTLAHANLAEAAKARLGIQSRCWDASHGLYADTPEHKSFSQHANALAVLYDVAPRSEGLAILDRITVPGGGIDAPAGVTGTTYYFSVYLAEALAHAGLADRYFGLLLSWQKLLHQHFTTWPENPDPTRSDSHAWSAHPTAGLLTYVAGIMPDAPGFDRVRISPHLGRLTRLEASMPHPRGSVRVHYAVIFGRLSATVELPSGVEGRFVYGTTMQALKAGINQITVADASSTPSRGDR